MMSDKPMHRFIRSTHELSVFPARGTQSIFYSLSGEANPLSTSLINQPVKTVYGFSICLIPKIWQTFKRKYTWYMQEMLPF